MLLCIWGGIMKSEIIRKNGVSYIAVDGKIIDHLAMKSFRPTKNNVGDFYKAGVKIFHVYCSGLKSGIKIPYSTFGETWFGNKDYRFENLDRQIDFFKETAPDSYVFINIHLDSRQWWHNENPGNANSFTHLSQIAANEKWRRDTADYLKALIKHTEEKYDDFVLGYFLLGGYTTEWFSDFDYEESHPVKLEAYRKYLCNEKAVIPAKELLEKPSDRIFLDSEKDADVIEYRKFHNNLIADTVLYFAHAAQEELNHNKIVGLFFGYIMELWGARLWNAGHIEFDKIYRSDDIDLIATPSSYQFRNYNDAGAYMLLSDTIDLNGKMYFGSFDHYTFKIATLEKEPRRLTNAEDASEGLDYLTKMRGGNRDTLTTRKQTIDAIRREFMIRMSKRTGMWWFDMLEGWYYDDELMEEIAALTKKSEGYVGIQRTSNSEIAVIVSAESMYYVNKCSDMNTELILNQRDALARMGAPYDIYSFNDIDKFDADKYKLFIFLNAFYMTDSQRKYIQETIKKNGRSILFIGTADNISGNADKMTGFKLSETYTDETTICAFDSMYGYKEAKKPTFYVNDEKAQTLGRYSQSRLCALAKKEFDDYTMYFSGLGNLSHNALREIARTAGVHIYIENGVAIYSDSAFIGVYNTKSEITSLTLGFDGEFEEIFSGKMYKTENGKVTFNTGENPANMLKIK